MATERSATQVMARAVSGPQAHRMRGAITTLLEALGEDVERDGLADTPARVTRSLIEMTSGYREDPAEILSTRFDSDYDQFVLLKNIDFVSMCEHHMLPFTGTAHVGYLPGDKVVGLSKLARLVHCFARRLQIQEQMTKQIADALTDHLHPRGVGVVIRAHHSCMSCRGVKQANAEMVTSVVLGGVRDDESLRSEFFQLLKA